MLFASQQNAYNCIAAQILGEKDIKILTIADYVSQSVKLNAIIHLMYERTNVRSNDVLFLSFFFYEFNFILVKFPISAQNVHTLCIYMYVCTYSLT